MELPKFKYSPNAYRIDVFKEEAGTCSVCNQPRKIKYDGPFYSAEEPEYICPWCIADGSAANEYAGEFNDAAAVETPLEYENDPALKASFDEQLLEVAERTPGYFSLQQEVWLSHCNEPCVFIGYADSETVAPFFDELEADIEKLGYDRDLIMENMSHEGSVAGYLFQCLHCGKHRLHVDSD